LIDAARRTPGILGGERVDLLLAATDAMLAMVRGTGEGRVPVPEPELLGRLGAAVTSLTGAAPSPTRVAPVNPLVAPATRGGGGRLEVRFRVLPSAQSPGPRAFLVHKKLSALGVVSSVRPSLEDLRAGAIPEGKVALVLDTAGGLDPVRAALALVPEVELLSVESLPPQPAAEVPPPVVAPTEPARTGRGRTGLLGAFLEAAGRLARASARRPRLG